MQFYFILYSWYPPSIYDIGNLLYIIGKSENNIGLYENCNAHSCNPYVFVNLMNFNMGLVGIVRCIVYHLGITFRTSQSFKFNDIMIDIWIVGFFLCENWLVRIGSNSCPFEMVWLGGKILFFYLNQDFRVTFESSLRSKGSI
jgi:hypothetical protein